MNDQPKTSRLFFALWPAKQTRQAIIEVLSSQSLPVKGRLIIPENLHVTLHFLGPVSEESKACMQAAAQSVEAVSFSLELDRFGYFPRAKIFWLGPRETPAALAELYRRLGRAIAVCGYPFEARGYTPHISLMRKCVKPEAGPADFSIPWHVDEFVLVESTTTASGAHYRVIEKYALS